MAHRNSVKYTPSTQRKVKLYTLQGVTKSLKEWAEYYNLKATTVRYRIYMGMDLQTALSFGPRENKPKKALKIPHNHLSTLKLTTTS